MHLPQPPRGLITPTLFLTCPPECRAARGAGAGHPGPKVHGHRVGSLHRTRCHCPRAGAVGGRCSRAHLQPPSPGRLFLASPILLLLPSVKLRMSSVILNEQCASEKKMPARCLINETWNLRGRPRILSKRRGKGGRTSATKAKRPQNIVLLAQAGCFAPKKCFLGGCKSSRKRNVMESLIFLRFGCDEAVHTLGTG